MCWTYYAPLKLMACAKWLMQNTATAWQLLDSLTIIYIETLSYFKVKPVTAMFIIFSNDGLTLKASIRWLYWYSVAMLA